MKGLFQRGPRRVLVHMISQGRSLSIEGILVAETKRDLVLYTAKVIEGDEASVSVTGQIEIPRENVVFKQVLV